MADERITPYVGKAGALPKTKDGLEPRWLRWQWLRRSAAYAESLNQLYRCEPGDDVLLLVAFCHAFALEYGEPPHPDDGEGWRKLECNDPSWQRLQDDGGRFVQVDGDSVCFDVPDGIITADVCDQIIAQVQALKDQLEGKRKRGGNKGSFCWETQLEAISRFDAGGKKPRGNATKGAARTQKSRDGDIAASEAEHVERQARQWRKALTQPPTK